MKKLTMILLAMLVVYFISKQSYCQTVTEDNRTKISSFKSTKEEDKKITMIIPADKYLDSIRTLKAEGYTIHSQVYNRRTDSWVVKVTPSSKSVGTNSNKNSKQSEIPDGVRTATYTNMDGKEVILEDTWIGGRLVQRKANGRLVDLRTNKFVK